MSVSAKSTLVLRLRVLDPDALKAEREILRLCRDAGVTGTETMLAPFGGIDPEELFGEDGLRYGVVLDERYGVIHCEDMLDRPCLVFRPKALPAVPYELTVRLVKQPC